MRAKIAVAVASVALGLGALASPALAEDHPLLFGFGPLTNPNGLAVDEATGDVYVATLGVNEQQTVSLEGGPTGGGFALEFEGQKTSQLNVGESAPTAEEVESALDGLSTIGAGGASVTQSGSLPETVAYTVTFEGALSGNSVPQLVCNGSALTGGTSPSCKVATTTAGVEGQVHKFDASGNPLEFSALHSIVLTGAATPSTAFSFPNLYGTPAAIAVDNSTEPGDPSRGDLYVMDAGHDVIDKFSPSGSYVSQITGLSEGELVGLGITATGDVRVAERISPVAPDGTSRARERIDLFDSSEANNFVTQLEGSKPEGSRVFDSITGRTPPQAGFAIGPTGDYYSLFECGCAEKFGKSSTALVGLGRVDNFPGDVALAVDPVSGHLYVDQQSSVAEVDTGGMDGYDLIPDHADEDLGSGALVSNFGSPQLSGVPAQQGGLAVDGATGEIYVANPADGKVYVFASSPPGVAAGEAATVSQSGATLRGSVDPRGVPITSCTFEYESRPKADVNLIFSAPVTAFAHSAPCAQTPAQIGSGTSPVVVSADIAGLKPGLLYYFRVVAGNAGGTASSQGMFATSDSGFGIASFAIAFLNQDGTPDTQAGSHPYEMVTSFTFNSKDARIVATADSPYELLPVDNARDIIIDTPPGLVGDPNATEKKCTLEELDDHGFLANEGACPLGSHVGDLFVETINQTGTGHYPLSNMVPPRGVAAQLGAVVVVPNAFVDVGLKAGEQYPLAAEALEIPGIEPLLKVRTTLFGVLGTGANRKPFLTLPTGCTGPMRSTISVDSYQQPGHYLTMSEITRNPGGEPLLLTGCSKLTFPPAITVAPDVSDASSSSGLSVGVHVPQTAAFNPEGLAESALRDTTVALPPGVTINPSGADGLGTCSEGLAGFTGFGEFNAENEPGVKWATFTPSPLEALVPGVSLCPDQSKIGTVKVKTPLLPNALEGAVYLATQNENPFGSLIAMYMMVEDPISGSTVKLAGEVRLCDAAGEVLSGYACQAPGQIVTTFKNTPDLPFEDLELHFFGGERAPLSTPPRCGTYTTTAVFAPWDGNSPVTSTSSFAIEHGPHGGACPGPSLPFSPSLAGGSTNINAGSFTPLTTTIARADGQQDMQSVQLHTPVGLEGLLSDVKLCDEADANAGTCGPGSQIGETTVAAGVGSDPVSVRGGRVYLTESYAGASFGLSIVNPVKAGPFDLEHDTANPGQQPPCDCVVVRAKIEVDPLTAALTITTDASGPHAIPHFIDGVPVQIQKVNVLINRPNFTFNPTNCNPLTLAGSIASDEGASSPVSIPFQATNCAVLKFGPHFSVSVTGRTSKANGAGLSVKLTYPPGSMGSEADVARAKVELPVQLPSRLTTLQKACLAAVFDANPASCPKESIVGHAVVHTPVLPVPLEGPAYFVSHGGEEFPNLTVVLKGYGVTVETVGSTFISAKGITSTTFKATPDVPFESFELDLPQGPYSALAANVNLCQTGTLAMPTEFIAQNGLEIHQNTAIQVEGCSTKLALLSHKLKGKTLTLAVYVPAAGSVKVSGRGLRQTSKRASAPGALSVSVHVNRRGRFKTTLKLTFAPSKGKRQAMASSLRV